MNYKEFMEKEIEKQKKENEKKSFNRILDFWINKVYWIQIKF